MKKRSYKKDARRLQKETRRARKLARVRNRGKLPTRLRRPYSM